VTLIPGFLILHSIGWVDTFYALIVPSLGNIWGMFLLRQYMMTIPESVEDSARLDGASEFTIYSRIILPLSKPALTTVMVFTFMSSWKAFQWPLIVTRSLKMRTVEIGVSMFSSQYSSNLPYQMAAATIVALPVLVAFFLAQQALIEGIDLTGGQR
ncbi:MAG: carbohydrate ABC transporter permease, partial [Clostridia bacterium]|nr:carbohydrate ABC transporter permease [Clostridia bacterium]